MGNLFSIGYKITYYDFFTYYRLRGCNNWFSDGNIDTKLPYRHYLTDIGEDMNNEVEHNGSKPIHVLKACSFRSTLSHLKLAPLAMFIRHGKGLGPYISSFLYMAKWNNVIEN